MGFINTYQYEDYSRVFDVADGDHIVIIMGSQVKQTQTSKQMLEVSLLVPAANNQIYIERYVEGDYFNQNMSKFFDAFGIQAGNFNFGSWVKKSAKGHFIHKEETYLDKQGMQRTVNRCKMQYLIVPENEQFTSAEQAGMNSAFMGNFQQPQPQQAPNWGPGAQPMSLQSQTPLF